MNPCAANRLSLRSHPRTSSPLGSPSPYGHFLVEGVLVSLGSYIPGCPIPLWTVDAGVGGSGLVSVEGCGFGAPSSHSLLASLGLGVPLFYLCDEGSGSGLLWMLWSRRTPAGCVASRASDDREDCQGRSWGCCPFLFVGGCGCRLSVDYVVAAGDQHGQCLDGQDDPPQTGPTLPPPSR